MLPVLDCSAVFVVFHIWPPELPHCDFNFFAVKFIPQQWRSSSKSPDQLIILNNDVHFALNAKSNNPLRQFIAAILFQSLWKNKQSQCHLWRRITSSALDDECPSRSQLGRLAFHFKPWIKVARRDLTGKCTWLTLECLWKHFLLWLERLRMEDLVTANDSQMRTQQPMQIFPLLFHSAPHSHSSTSIRIHRISGSFIFL